MRVQNMKIQDTMIPQIEGPIRLIQQKVYYHKIMKNYGAKASQPLMEIDGRKLVRVKNRNITASKMMVTEIIIGMVQLTV
jgi:hypothetical protein